MKSSGVNSFLSLLCAIGVFYLSIKFQEMAYWGNGLTWYWIGVTFTYLIWILGLIFIALSFIKRESHQKTFFTSILGTVSVLALVMGFLWTTFVIIAGMSGM